MQRSIITPGDGDHRHGTDNGYDNLSCRCAECTEAHRTAHHAYMHRDPERLERHRVRSADYYARLKEQKNANR